jgi:hypothetical protein
MPTPNGTMAGIARFVSIAVLSCLLITGGMWVYQNRDEILGDSASEGRRSGTWFTRWAGVDATRLKVEQSPNWFDEQSPKFPTAFEFDGTTIQQLNQPVQFDWDTRNR